MKPSGKLLFRCPMMIKTKNKQTNNHYLDAKYFSQSKSNRHETFKETFYRCPTIIKTKDQLIHE